MSKSCPYISVHFVLHIWIFLSRSVSERLNCFQMWNARDNLSFQIRSRWERAWRARHSSQWCTYSTVCVVRGGKWTHTHKRINTDVIYLKTFANMVNLSGKDSRILQLRFNRENHVAEKSQSRAQRRCGGQRKWFFLYVDVQNVPPQSLFSGEIHM